MNANKEAKNKKGRIRLRSCYSFLTITLIFCIMYFSYSVFMNITKCINMPAKILKMKELNKAAIAQNKRLKDEIANFESLHSLEAIARNNLKMAAEDEILVIVNQENTEAAVSDKN